MLVGFFDPLFSVNNFRPVGHVYFAVMGRLFGENFPPWMTPIFALHLINGTLVFLLARMLKIGAWHALAAVGVFFTWTAGAMDAYWKPMYSFDLLCTTFSLASILFYSQRRWLLSFVAFWCAYKAKELAVMLPLVLVAWEWWFGERKFWRLIPFGLVSLSFGLQGLLRNPNIDNEYTFRFNVAALRATVPFYARRFLCFVAAGCCWCRWRSFAIGACGLDCGIRLFFCLRCFFIRGDCMKRMLICRWLVTRLRWRWQRRTCGPCGRG